MRFAKPGVTPADGEEAAHRVVRTYLAAYGPAPREQFQRWFGMQSPAEAGRWLQALGDEVTEVEQGWMLAADAAEAAAAEPAGAVRLLPAFDPYVVAAPRKADAVLAAAHRAEVYRPQGWLSPVLLVDGVVRGVWSRERDAIELAPFGRLPAAVRTAAADEAERLGASFTVDAHAHAEGEAPAVREIALHPDAVPPITTGAMSVPPPSSPPPSPQQPEQPAVVRETLSFAIESSRGWRKPRVSEEDRLLLTARASRSSTAASCRRRSSSRSGW